MTYRNRRSGDDLTVPISMRIPISLRRRLENHADEHGTSMTTIVLTAVEAYLNDKENEAVLETWARES